VACVRDARMRRRVVHAEPAEGGQAQRPHLAVLDVAVAESAAPAAVDEAGTRFSQSAAGSGHPHT
jgi:hypothetical protein